MPKDYYITLDMDTKKRFLAAVEVAQNHGQVVEVQTAHGVSTRFDSKNMDLSLIHQRLVYSIATDRQFNPADPVQSKCRENLRTASTRVAFNLADGLHGNFW